jgi:LuxR family maltose regulon positive regulatory protein
VSAPILRTKLIIPPRHPRERVVPRRRLIEKLDNGLGQGNRLTLVSAPAGFGKTTLLSEWAAGWRGPVAWLTLDQGDREPTQFWSYVVTALGTIRTGIGETVMAKLFSSQPPPISDLLIDLLNAIDTGAPRPLAIVLDDFHLVEESSIHNDLAFFLDHLPPQVHLVIATRYDPSLPLSRLRGRGELNEVRTADLRFTPDEAVAFLNQVMGLELTADQVSALETRTEGWIAGLQMAALSMQGRGRQGRANFIAAFAGSHRYVLDYLADEVLLQQPEEVRTFLTRTSILERLTGSLCDHVCGRSDSGAENGRPGGQETLAQLESANLFILPLDDERRWYRYHHLFADLLRKRLGEAEPALVPTLHRRAAAWYEKEKLTADAMNHALAAGDLGHASRLVGANALAMMEHGELRTLVGWLDALPEEAIHSQPWLAVAHAWMLAFTGQPDAADFLLRGVEEAIDAGTIPPGAPLHDHPEERAIRGHIAAIRTQTATVRGNAQEAAAFARRALTLLPADDYSSLAWTSVALGLNLERMGDLAAADQVLTEAVALGRRAGDGHVAVMALCNLAATQVIEGELHRAADTYREAMRAAEAYARRAGRQLPVSGYAYTFLALVLCEWNELDAAVDHVEEGIQRCEQWGEPQLLVGGYTCLAEIRRTIGDTAGALDAIQKAEQVAESISSWYRAQVEKDVARIRLKTGDLAGASRWADAHEGWLVGSLDALESCPAGLILSQIRLAQARPAEALAIAAQVRKTVGEAGAGSMLVKSLILQAVARQALGQCEQAQKTAEEVLLLAERENYVRMFLDQGEPMIRLLRAAAENGIAPDYAERLLDAWERESKGGDELKRPTLAETLLEPLSEREMDVLRLLAAGLSNREIAQELYLSINTIKTHAKSIYGKLAVNRRTQAVNRARELGLL